MATDELGWRVLGPFEVRRAGQPIGPAGAKRRGLLAMLVLQANHVVSTSELIDGLWGEQLPASATNLVQTYVSAWRKALEPDRRAHAGGDRLVTVGSGYRLRVEPGELDLEDFRLLVDDGTRAAAAGRHREAAGRLEQALVLWRGAPLADLLGQPFAHGALERLDDVRVRAVEAWAEAELRAGNPHPVYGRLSQERERYPLRESLTELVMWALSASGRQADALAAYERTRRLLAEELGADPGEALQEMHAKVLRQDPGLRPTPLAVAPSSPRGADQDRGSVPASAELPLRSSHEKATRLDNLPQSASSFVGRGPELMEVRALVQQSRLVTLTGPGGVGKTRLAVQVAASLDDGAGDATWFVELASLDDPEAVPGAVANALGVATPPGRDVRDALVEVLAGQHVLIVLDNCEHLIAACATLADSLLRGCRHVHLLATSRERLGIDGEHVFRVPSLSLPEQDTEDPSALAAFGAVTLFVERAGAQATGFALTADTAALVVGICRHLDGLPLAIELAAARLPSMSLVHVHDRLNERFRLLTGGSRTALPRQQTLRATVDWSYDLLSRCEQILLRRLCVFVGAFDLEAVEGVCAFGEVRAGEVDELLGSLVDKSLVLADPSGPLLRYRLLETLRQYGTALLTELEVGEAERLRAAHASYYATYAEHAADGLKGPSQTSWLARVEEAYPNLRLATEHLLSTAEGAAAALRLFGATRWYWWYAAHDADALLLLDRALDLAPPWVPPSTRATALLCKAYLLYSWDLAAEGACVREAVELSRLLGDRALQAEALSFLSTNAAFRGVPVDGLEPGAEAVALARRLGDPALLGDALLRYAGVVGLTETDKAEAIYLEALAVLEDSGDSGSAMLAHSNFGSFLLSQGRPAESREHLEAALAMSRTRIPGSRPGAVILTNLATVLLEQGNVAAAKAHFSEALRRAQRSGEITVAQYATFGLANCATFEGHDRRAAILHGCADALLAVLGGALYSPETEYRERDFITLHDHLGADFDSLYQKGRSMPRAEILAFGLAEAAQLP